VGSLEQHGLAAEGKIHSTLSWLVQSIQQAQQCAFARTIGTNECHLLTRENLQRDILKRLHTAQVQTDVTE